MNVSRRHVVVSIKPEPSLEELVAITAAVGAAVRSLAPVATPSEPEVSRWARTGRLEAMGGLDREEDRL